MQYLRLELVVEGDKHADGAFDGALVDGEQALSMAQYQGMQLKIRNAYPNNPDSQAALHVALALRRCTHTRLSAIALRRWRRLESLVCLPDVQQDHSGPQRWNEKAHNHVGEVRLGK
jgi:hypothetical protein